MGVAAPLGLLGLLLLAPVIAMYLLKRRREEVAVSSIYLWERVVQDIEANAPWQKLRRNLLLLLQLLFLLLAVFGLARPFLTTAGATGQSLIFVLDTSVSMATRDTDEGSRLDAARAELLRLMEGLPDDGRVTVIRAGDGADIIAANTDDFVAVRSALSELTPLARDSNLAPALTLAAAAAARQADSEIVILSDGGVQLPASLVVDRPIRYLSIGRETNNQAVSALNLTRTEEGFDLFVQVTNYGRENVTRRLLVEIDGNPFTASDFIIPAGQQASKIFPIDEEGSFQVQARLEGEDALVADDVAWAVPGPSSARRVHLITPSQANRFLSVPFTILPDVQFSQGTIMSDTVPLEGDEETDLLILDRWLPEQGLPGTTENLLVVAPPGGNDLIQTTGVITNPLPVKSGNVPLIEDNLFFDSDLFFVEARVGELPSWGTSILEDAISGAPLLWIGEYEGRRIAVFNLALYGVPESLPLDPPRDVVLTNLLFQPAYPILMATLADYLLAGPAGGLAGSVLLPGEAIPLPLLDAEHLEVRWPDGQVDQLTREGGDSSISFVAATPGIYEVRWVGSEQEAIQFAVNLFLPSESAIAPVPELNLTTQNGGGAQAEATLSGEAQLDIWRPFLLVALLILAVEWIVYQRDAVRRLRDWRALIGRGGAA